MAEVEVPHQNQPNVVGISLLFIQFSLFVLCHLLHCCQVLLINYLLNYAYCSGRSLSLECDYASSLERELHGLPFMQWISTIESFTSL